MPHSHHGDAAGRVSPHVQRLLLLVLAPFLLATLVGLFVLWPSGSPAGVVAPGAAVTTLEAEVTGVAPSECPDVAGQENFDCSTVEVRLEQGPDLGETFSFEYSRGPRTRAIEVGDAVIVGSSGEPPVDVAPGTEPPPQYYFVDFDRRTPLLVLGVAFAAVVIALSRWRGLAALAGLAVSLLVLVKFVLPAILDGNDPLLVAIVGGATIMFLALYLAHGVNAATTTAVLGTLSSLLLTGLLALVFVNLSIFTGAGSEEAAFLQVNQQQVDLQGLLLASIVIGTLGVLDDVTVTQASAVWELHRANPRYGVRRLYQAALRVGRDHIASTVNTLVLAYAGASLPLLMLFSISERPLGQVINTETVAEEIVRTLVGSIGLVASVPVTTALAAVVVTSGVTRRVRDGSSEEDDTEDAPFTPPRRERLFREEGP